MNARMTFSKACKCTIVQQLYREQYVRSQSFGQLANRTLCDLHIEQILEISGLLRQNSAKLAHESVDVYYKRDRVAKDVNDHVTVQ